MTTRSQLQELVPKGELDRLEEASQPQWLKPMLATLTDKRFSDPGWIYERKLDGERILAWRSSRGVRLLTRNRKEVNANYPEVVEALEGQAGRFIVDGEIVAFDGNVSSFSRLQQRMQISDPDEARATGIAVYFYLFDIVFLDGYRLEELSLRTRKKLLKAAIGFTEPLRYTSHRNERGEEYFEQACHKGWEGVIAKDATHGYVHSRSRAWLKFKCSKSQELVIGGFTAPRGSRAGFGALLVGYYEDGELRYAGKVGTGYDDEFLESFRGRLDRLSRTTSPFAGSVKMSGDVTWVTPKLVGEFGFTEWTRAGKLRHPRFLGLRRDKAAVDVTREEPG
jgi:bifunctional non-homologous end joining protein LigD